MCVCVNLLFANFISISLYVFTENYYLVDSGYPNEYGFLGPYRGQRYHLQEFYKQG